MALFFAGMPSLAGQSQEKHRVRLKADYIKQMDARSYLDIKASARINKQTVAISGVELLVINEIDGEEIELGKLTTDQKGEGVFALDLNALKADSLHTYSLGVSFMGTDSLRRASRTVQFKDAALKAYLITRDSVYYIEAVLKDAVTDSLISEQNVKVQVQRLFAPLVLSDEINLTDDTGTILVAIPEGIPGVDSRLTIETVLEDSDDYGTLKATLDAPIGVPIIDESTYDERTLWGPRGKTPIFILLFTGLLVVGTWGTILYLIRILFKIAKH
ncbi:MAG: hypothetical protein KJO04_03015 [Bacteroidia bacterium]|nr:hypothetical protein [Bacteroidia bacterium]